MTYHLLLLSGLIGLGSYLLGSLNFAVILSKALYREDIRVHGSGNAGMTNMLRTYGKKAAALTALGDLAKTAVAVMLSRWAFARFGAPFPLDFGYVAGLCVVLGHVFPVFSGFRGGKGVVATLGIMLCVNPLAFLIITVIFIPVAYFTRIVSLASVLGAVAYPGVTWLLLRLQAREPRYDTIAAAVLGMMVIVMHRQNIGRLVKGTEPRFGRKKQTREE